MAGSCDGMLVVCSSDGDSSVGFAKVEEGQSVGVSAARVAVTTVDASST